MTETLTACPLLQGGSFMEPESHLASQAAGFLCLAIPNGQPLTHRPRTQVQQGQASYQNICMDCKNPGSQSTRF